MTTPYTQDSSGAQTNERNAVARIESGPRLLAHADSTVATLDSDVALRLGPGLLHALHGRHPDGRLATGDVPVVSTAQDPRPANVDENDNRKWEENDMYSDAWDRSTPAQSSPAGAVALSRARSTNPEMFRRGWKSAVPPNPELPPHMDDSEGQTAILFFNLSWLLTTLSIVIRIEGWYIRSLYTPVSKSQHRRMSPIATHSMQPWSARRHYLFP